MSQIFHCASFLAIAMASQPEGPIDQTSLRYVFSTGCNAYQHWQGEVLKASAWRVGNRVPITHIVVGCNQEQQAGVEQDAHTSAGGDADRLVTEKAWRKSANPNVDYYFVPATEMAKRFPWFNKVCSSHRQIDTTC